MVTFPWSYLRNARTYGALTVFGLIVYILIVRWLNHLDDNVYVVKIDKKLSAALDMPLNNHKVTMTEWPKSSQVPLPNDDPGHSEKEQPKPAPTPSPKHDPINRVSELPEAPAMSPPPKNKPANLVTELIKAAQTRPPKSQPVITDIEHLELKSKPKDVKPSGPKVEVYDYKKHPGCNKCAEMYFLVYTVLSSGNYQQRLALRKAFQDSFEQSTSMLIFIAEQSSYQDILQEANKFGDIITMPTDFNNNQFDMFAFEWIQSCCVSLHTIAKINGNVKGILDKVLNIGDRIIQGKVQLGSKIYCKKKTQEFKTVITKATYNQNLLERHCSSDKGVYFSMDVVQKLLSVQNENNNQDKL